MVFDNQTTKIILMVLFSVLPSLVYFLLVRSFKRRWQQRLRNIRWIDAYYEYELFNQTSEAAALCDVFSDRAGRRAARRLGSRSRSSASSPESGSQLPSHCQPPKYYIGDLSCRYNAFSPHLRCAVNPEGPCENCTHYDQKY
jgi:hypothetical protein